MRPTSYRGLHSTGLLDVASRNLAESYQQFEDTGCHHLHGTTLSFPDYRARRAADCKGSRYRIQHETHIRRLLFQAPLEAPKHINSNCYILQMKSTRDDRQNLILSNQTLARKTIFQSVTFTFITYWIHTQEKTAAARAERCIVYIDMGRCTTDRAEHSGGEIHIHIQGPERRDIAIDLLRFV